MIKLPLTADGTTTLGALIDTLATLSPEATVQYDFCYLAPTTLDSYRGYYDHLALGWTDTDSPDRFKSGYWPTVSEVLEALTDGVGRTYQGWKGGSFMMGRNTPLWVANPGQTGSTGIVGVRDSHAIILVTEIQE